MDGDESPGRHQCSFLKIIINVILDTLILLDLSNIKNKWFPCDLTGISAKQASLAGIPYRLGHPENGLFHYLFLFLAGSIYPKIII